MTDRDIIRRILRDFTNTTAREIARIGGFQNLSSLNETLTFMTREGLAVRTEDGEGTRTWRYALPTREQARMRQATIYHPSAERSAEGRLLWRSVAAAALLVGWLLTTPAQAQPPTPPTIADPAHAEFVWTSDDPTVIRFACYVKLASDPKPAQPFQCGFPTPGTTGVITQTQPLPAWLTENGTYTITVEACSAVCSDPSDAFTFIVNKQAPPQEPPPGTPPPTRPRKPVIITVRPIAASSPTSAPAVARFRASAATSSDTVRTKIPPPLTVGLDVPFTELGRVTVCLTPANGVKECHTADWWIGLIPPTQKP